MYKIHRWVRSPRDPNTSIFRYFRLNRFEDLIESRELYCTRLDQFDDPWEGVLPPNTVPLEKDHFTNEPRTAGDELTDFEVFVREGNRLNRMSAYASCWYQSSHESDAMWRLYGAEGVAIRSTFARLCSSLESEQRDVFVGGMYYLDYETEQPPTYGNTLCAPFCKRIEFSHERELRAVVVQTPSEWKGGLFPYDELRDTHPKGIRLTCDLEQLIDRIYVAPYATPSFKARIEDLLVQADIHAPVVASSLSERPSLI